ncbi:MAG: lactate utilization protein [Treponema sp.]|nr:lactate utilization protein [Treponema sp.]
MAENEYRKWFGAKRGRMAVKAFGENGWTSYYAETLEEARRILFDTCLPQGVSVGLGGSETLKAMNVLDELRTERYKLFDRYNCRDHFEVCRESLMAEYFITGANALTMKGEMVNLDCSGSRVAAMAYGPRHLIVVAGINKLVDTVDEAISRARSVAPMNCNRNRHDTHCAETGICAEKQGLKCNTPQRMCNHLLITLNARKFEGKYSIVIINEELGF